MNANAKPTVDQQIAEAVAEYAEFHGVRLDAVDVQREREGGDGPVVRFRLSLDASGHSRGFDEWYEVADAD